MSFLKLVTNIALIILVIHIDSVPDSTSELAFLKKKLKLYVHVCQSLTKFSWSKTAAGLEEEKPLAKKSKYISANFPHCTAAVPHNGPKRANSRDK